MLLASRTEVSRDLSLLLLGRFSPAHVYQTIFQVTDAAKRMLWYPAAYSVVCISLAIMSFFDATTLQVSFRSLHIDSFSVKSAPNF